MDATRLETVRHLLGDRMGTLQFVSSRVTSVEDIDGARLENIEFMTNTGTAVPARFLHPKGDTPAAAVLYCHAHGGAYDIGTRELTEGRKALDGPYAEDLAAGGYAALCLEMPCFGSRSGESESASSKAHLWHGTTLFGEMVAEQVAGLTWLAEQPSVDANRIATLGISMGGTLAWWVGALDRRVAAIVSMCCFADMECLIGTGNHDGHGAYMTVPGLLRHMSTGDVAGLAAPRPQLQCVGLQDWSTPPQCFDQGRRDLEAAYSAAGAPKALEFYVEPDHGHEETPAMRQRVLGFLRSRIGGGIPDDVA